MEIKRRILNHNKRWNIQVDRDQQFAQLKNRVIGVANEFIGEFFAKNVEIDEQFDKILIYTLGKEIKIETLKLKFPDLHLIAKEINTERAFGSTYVYKAIKEASDTKNLVTVLQVLFWILEEHRYHKQTEFSKQLKEVAELTPGVGFHIAPSKNRVVFYPSGAELLDKGTVNDVLSGLENYPKVAKHFEQALKIYMDGDSSKYRNLLDNLRFSIEQLLKEILGNKKSLENQKNELLNWLNQKGNHQEIVNLYNQLLFGGYSMYQNNAVKHSEAFSKNDIEFMIYLTGTFIRFLLQLVQISP